MRSLAVSVQGLLGGVWAFPAIFWLEFAVLIGLLVGSVPGIDRRFPISFSW